MMIKYPLHKVAKDFKKGGKDLPSKAVMDILTQYGHPPKNHMQEDSHAPMSWLPGNETKNGADPGGPFP